MMVALLAPQASFAQAKLKLIMLTADWCANCRVLEPAIARALETFSADDVDYVEIDLTRMNASDDARRGISAASRVRLSMHRADWIWEKHAERTGLSFLIAADTGEPLACLTSAVPAETIAEQLQLAGRLIESTEPGRRSTGGTDCPSLIG